MEKLRSALFIVGEVGSYDYYYALSQGKTMEDVKSMVSDVVQAILDGAKVSSLFITGSVVLLY